VAFIRGLDFPMPKIFALLEAAGHALDCSVAVAQAVVARSVCCDSSWLWQCKHEHLSTGEGKENKKTINRWRQQWL